MFDDNTTDPDATFTYCEDCQAEHNGRGETREQYAQRVSNKPTKRSDQLQRALEDLRGMLEKDPLKNATMTLNYVQAAAIDRANTTARLAQVAITTQVAELQTIRTIDGKTTKVEIGDVIAALARVAVDAACSCEGALDPGGPESLKALFSALVDECAAYYRENRASIDKRIEAQKKIAEAMLTSLELSLATAKANEERAEAEAEKRGDAEKALTIKATTVARSNQSDAEKEKEMATLLKAFSTNKNTKVH